MAFFGGKMFNRFNKANYTNRKKGDIQNYLVDDHADEMSIFHSEHKLEHATDNPEYIEDSVQFSGEGVIQWEELKKKLELKERQNHKLKRRFQVFMEESGDVFQIIKADGTVKYINEASKKVIGYKPEELLGGKIFDLYKGEERQKLKDMLDFLVKNPKKTIQGDVKFINKIGIPMYLEVNMKNFLDEPVVKGIVVRLRNITRRIEIEKRMSYISTHDYLTGLPNRTYFKKQLKIQCQYADEAKSRFALMMLDIEGLKYINYSLGYEMGDKLIKEIVNKLKAQLGEKIFISRYSEDHFAIIMPGHKRKPEYDDMAKGIIQLFEKPFMVENYELDVHVNIGICIYPNDTKDPESIRKQAKVALLRAKREGKNTYKFHSSDLDIQHYKEFVLRNDLHHAIEKGQLRVFYQPIVDLKNCEVLAVEALVRWEHPEWGTVSSDEFIYLAEESGLIIHIGKWVLREVCKNYKEWMNKGLPPVKVSVNLSAIQLMENNFESNIQKIIEEYDLDPKFLILEITESVFIKNIARVTSDIQALRTLGIQIALDDFGTGFSSLVYLNYLNVDIIKLDCSFIKEVPADNTGAAIVKSVICLTQELKIKLVVEGIENWEQLSFLRYLNCHAGQGYIYSKPVEADKIEGILGRRTCKPVRANDLKFVPKKDRRKFFRIKLPLLLESVLKVLEIKGRKVNVGNTMVLVKNIGPGGLCFISDIRFPVQNDIVLEVAFRLLEEEVKVKGHIIWSEEIESHLYKYGIEFLIDENERMDLIRILNQVQIKIKKNILFAEGSFISTSYNAYFKQYKCQ